MDFQWWRLLRDLRQLQNNDIEEFCKILLAFNARNPDKLRIKATSQHDSAGQKLIQPKIEILDEAAYAQKTHEGSLRRFKENLIREWDWAKTVKNGNHLKEVK
jgi:hypothetical protein